jgi:hypothetical protein
LTRAHPARRVAQPVTGGRDEASQQPACLWLLQPRTPVRAAAPDTIKNSGELSSAEIAVSPWRKSRPAKPTSSKSLSNNPQGVLWNAEVRHVTLHRMEPIARGSFLRTPMTAGLVPQDFAGAAR